MSPTQPLLFDSFAVLDKQQQLIEADIRLKREQQERLQTLEKTLTDEEALMNQATLKAQQFLLKAPFYHASDPPPTGNPLAKMQLLMEQAQYVKTRQALLDSEETFKRLNAAVGKTNALARVIEDQADELDQLLLAFSALVEEGEKTLELSQQISKENS